MYYFMYVGVTNKLALLKFCHLGWYRCLVWPMDYKSFVSHQFHCSYLKANKISKSEKRRVECTYHLQKCADAIYLQ